MGKKQNDTPLTEVDAKRIRRNAYIKMAAMVGIVVAAIAFGSIAWFTMNREVEGSGVQMTASDLPFEIATKGTNGIRYQSLLQSLNTSNKTGETTVISGTTYYQTSGDTDKIMLRYDTGNSEIGPSGRGQLSLYLIPKDNIDINAKVTLDVQSYAFFDVYMKDADGNKVQKVENDQPVFEEDGITPVYQTTEKLLNVNEVTADMCTLEADDIARIQQSGRYLKGHIMFFGGSGYEDNTKKDSEQWYFTTPYPSRSFVFEQKNAEKGKMYPIPVYWMWPNTFGQIALKQDDPQRSGISVVKDLTDSEVATMPNDPLTDKELVISYLMDNKDAVLKGWNSMEFTPDEILQTRESDPNHITLSEVVDNMINNADNVSNFSRLSDCYNAADFAIGKDIAYFIIEVTVENAE